MDTKVLIDPSYQNQEKPKGIKGFLLGLKDQFINLSKFKKFLVVFVMLLIFGGITTLIINLQSILNPQKETKTWIISQSLASVLGRQQVLTKNIYGGEVELEDLVKAATASVLPKEEAVRIGDKTIMSTSSLGQVTADFPQGRYKVAVVPIPGVDLTGIPNKIDLLTTTQEIPIGIKKGSGKVLGFVTKFNAGSKRTQSKETTKLIISLFHDLNGDGKKQKEEQKLRWAGVIVELIKE